MPSDSPDNYSEQQRRAELARARNMVSNQPTKKPNAYNKATLGRSIGSKLDPYIIPREGSEGAEQDDTAHQNRLALLQSAKRMAADKVKKEAKVIVKKVAKMAAKRVILWVVGLLAPFILYGLLVVLVVLFAVILLDQIGIFSFL